MEFKIQDRWIGPNHPTYFIADIAANHDGDLNRAKLLIRLAKEAGADAAKFQHFQAPKIVSEYGFTHMNSKVSHQASWKKSVRGRPKSVDNLWTDSHKLWERLAVNPDRSTDCGSMRLSLSPNFRATSTPN